VLWARVTCRGRRHLSELSRGNSKKLITRRGVEGAPGHKAGTLRSRGLQSPQPKETRVLTLPSGSHLGPYEILEPIGAGGMGEIHRADGPSVTTESPWPVLTSKRFEAGDD
jgi:hypothetical protein